MKHPAIQLVTLFLIILQFQAFTQPAPWISYPSANQTAYGVYHFRKSFDLEKVA
jgi:alpha-L-rhamnosidase